jgi:hypothetical protein
MSALAWCKSMPRVIVSNPFLLVRNPFHGSEFEARPRTLKYVHRYIAGLSASLKNVYCCQLVLRRNHQINYSSQQGLSHNRDGGVFDTSQARDGPRVKGKGPLESVSGLSPCRSIHKHSPLEPEFEFHDVNQHSTSFTWYFSIIVLSNRPLKWSKGRKGPSKT